MIVEAHKSQESHHLRLRNMAWGWLNGFCFHSTRIPFQPWHSRHKCVCIDVEHTPPPFIVHRICHCVRCGCLCVFLCSFVCLCRGWGVIEQCESLWDDCDTSHRHWMVVASHHTKSSMPFRWPTAKFIYNNEIATPEQRSKRKNMNPHTTTVIHVDYNLLYVGILLLLFHFFFFFCFSLLFRDFRLSSRPHRRSIYISNVRIVTQHLVVKIDLLTPINWTIWYSTSCAWHCEKRDREYINHQISLSLLFFSFYFAW